MTLTGVPDRPGVAGRVFTALADAHVNVDMIIQNEPVADDALADISFTVERDDLPAVETHRRRSADVCARPSEPTTGWARSRSWAPA